MEHFEICQQHNSEFTAYDSNRNELLCNGCLFTIQRLEEHILPLCEVVRRTKHELDSSFSRYFHNYEKARSVSTDKIIEQKSADVDGFFKDILSEAEKIKQLASHKAENSAHIQKMKQKVATNQELEPQLVECRFKEKEIFDKCLEQRKYLYIVKRKQHYEQHLNDLNHSEKVLDLIENEIQSEMKDVAVVKYKKDLVENSLNQIVESQIEVDDSLSIPIYSNFMRPQIDSEPIVSQMNQNLIRPQNYSVQQPKAVNNGYCRKLTFEDCQNSVNSFQSKEIQETQFQRPSLIELTNTATIENCENILEKIAAMKQSGYRPVATKEILKNTCFTPISDMVSGSKEPQPQESFDVQISPNKQQQEEYLSESTLCENQETMEKSLGEELQQLYQDKIDNSSTTEVKTTPAYCDQQLYRRVGKLNLLASIFPDEIKECEVEKPIELPKPAPRINLIPLQSEITHQYPSDIKFAFNRVN